jgi:hypothetical protein
MGLNFSRIWERMFGKKEMRILMVGLDAAGKVRSNSEFGIDLKKNLFAVQFEFSIGETSYCLDGNENSCK